jgi:hypothetical protein
MKLIKEFDAYAVEITIKDDCGVTVYEMMEIIEVLLIASGYTPELVKDGFLNKAQEIESNQENKK